MTGICVFLAAVGLFNPVLVNGPDALWFNPAQLGGPDRPGFSCRIVDLGVGMDNNSFTFDQYNRYTGAYLDGTAKDDILRSIPVAGLALGVRGDAAAIEFGWSNFAVSTRTVAVGRVRLPRDVFDLALCGNEPGRTYTTAGAAGNGRVYLKAGMALAGALGRHVAVGIGFHYLRGLACAELTRAEANLLTTPTLLAADGIVAYRTAGGGSGYCGDVGVACWFKGWRFSLAGLGFGPGITWTERLDYGVYSFELDSGNVYDIRMDRLYDDEFVRQTGPAFTTRLPVNLNLGASREFTDWFNSAVLLETRLWGTYASENGWRASGVAEFVPWTWLPLAGELGYDSRTGPDCGLAAGVILGRFVLRTRVRLLSGLVMQARGFEAGFGISYAELHRESGPDVFRIHYDMD